MLKRWYFHHPPELSWRTDVKIASFTSCFQKKGKGQGCDMGPVGELGDFGGRDILVDTAQG